MKKKILFYLPYLSGGGAERVIINLLKTLSRDRYFIILAVINVSGPYYYLLPEDIQVIKLGNNRILFSILGLSRLLRREKPHIVISALNYANIIAVLAVKLARVNTRVILTVHNNYSQFLEHLSFWKRVVINKLISLTYKKAYKIVSVSKGLQENFISSLRMIHLADKFVVIYNPISINEITDKAKEKISNKWLNDPEPKVIISAGRLIEQKDHETLINAFYHLKHSTILKIKLIILGDGDYKQKLLQQIESLGLEEDVDLIGFVGNPFAYIAKANVFVLSSRWEGFGNVIVEAMICRTPVISTNCPYGPNEIITDGVNGYLVDVGDYIAMACKIAKVLDNRDISNKLTENALIKAKRFDSCTITRQYENIF